jgi:hypothetical protein
MGSFLDTLLLGALGTLRTQTVSGGGSVQALSGALILADATGSSPTVQAPLNPIVGTYFGVADVQAQSGAHAINVASVGASFQLENPASVGTYSNAVTIATTGRVRFWLYAGPSPGWKLLYGVF